MRLASLLKVVERRSAAVSSAFLFELGARPRPMEGVEDGGDRRWSAGGGTPLPDQCSGGHGSFTDGSPVFRDLPVREHRRHREKNSAKEKPTHAGPCRAVRSGSFHVRFQ